ncbi:MAG: hypothetical protein AB1631_28560, partial [Acidobacteriota bacterium]
MPRTLPAGISALIGSKNLQFVWLVEWQMTGATRYFSSDRAVTYGGNNYVPRVLSISGLTAQFIDRKERDFEEITIEFDNLSDTDNSNSFYFTGLTATENFEDRLIKIHLYEVTAGTAVDSLWIGFSKRPKFSSDQKTMNIGATFLFDYLKIPVPKHRFQHRCAWAFINETPDGLQSLGCPYTSFGTPGFTTCDKRGSSCSSRGMTRFFSGWPKVGLNEAKKDRG